MLMKNGGITSFKFHLAHTNLHNNSKKCPRVPREVKEEIDEIQRHVIDKDDDDDDDVYMYSADMHPYKQDAYQAIVHTLKVIEWN
ncbi:hypothetical protein CK203_117342 [Vitis vinifera]|uniref:Uncharacterized protein n=1 Tax=Vitis vinifera TaxID=29760 RepID=A0A438FCM8_VITVI|nr:hypothetical protein CK203_117342 [Vitis vinifera]